MNIKQFFMSLFQKQSQGRIALSWDKLGQPVNTPANYLAFSKEGYNKNAIVYRCINMIATNAAGIEWEVYKGKTELENHPLKTLLSRPNPMQGQSSFFENLVGYFKISGNFYVEAVSANPNKPPNELWTLRPDLMKIVPNALGYAGKYVFKTGAQEKVWEVDPVTMQANILHGKTFNPIDIWYGMSPLEAAMMGVDQYNQSNRWNLSLLQNMAAPSGILKVATNDVNPTGSLSNEQFQRLRNEFENSYSGSRNSGKPLILEGGVDWQSISLSPKEMDWINSREVTALDIMNVYGVPAQLLGYGESTYSNYGEAREALYEETILPLMDFLKTELNNWLAPRYGDVVLDYDKDDIEVLVNKRERKYTTINNVNFLTINEKRQAVGYEKAEGWDVFVIGNQILETPDQWSTMESSPPDSEEPEGGIDDGEETSEGQDTEEEVIIEDEDLDDKKAFKSFNLINRDDKLTNWRRVNRKRNQLERPFARSLETDFEELARDLEKAIKGKDPRTAEYAMQLAIDKSMVDIEKTIKRYIKFTVNDFGQTVFNEAKSLFTLIETKKNEKTWNDWAEHYIKTRTGTAITLIEGTTRKQVRRVVQDLVREAVAEDSEINVASELRKYFTELSSGRARNIARTEVASASNTATLEAAKSLEIEGLQKEWVSLQDDRTRDGDGPNPGVGANHLDMNGVRVGLDEKFTVPPDVDMDAPGDPSAPAEQICNCRCTVIFTVAKRR
jgi:HK97 family phage portal protein